jgi:thymidylate synthase (FAD)
MKIIEPSFEILTPFTRESVLASLKLIELAGRTCYKSEGAITCDSASPFVTKIATVFKHESVIEHSLVTVKFVCDRGVSHEIVRHRLAAYSQESTRYCNYTKEKFDGHIVLIHPPGLSDAQKQRREEYFWLVQKLYDAEITEGLSAQLARGILPNALKTEIVMSCNYREWRHVFKMRTSSKAHPQMQQLMRPLLIKFQEVLPELFNDICPPTPSSPLSGPL